MPRDCSHTLKQLSEARKGCLTTIEAMEKASASDGADRSMSIASIKRDLASYDAQVARLQPSPAPAVETISKPTK